MRLIVVEDEPHWQATIQEIAHQAGYEIIASCANLREAVRTIRTERFDLLIADLGLPDGSGIEAIRATRRFVPEADILVATVFADENSVVAAICAGATGYLLKESTPAQWIAAINDLRAGHSPISPKIARFILRAMQQPAHSNRLMLPDEPFGSAQRSKADGAEAPKLSPREIEVLKLVAKGFTLIEVGQLLHISSDTVRSHAKSVYRKLEVNSRGEAVFEASRLGLI